MQILPAASEGPQEWPKANVLSPTTYMGPYGDVFHKNEKKIWRHSSNVCTLILKKDKKMPIVEI